MEIKRCTPNRRVYRQYSDDLEELVRVHDNRGAREAASWRRARGAVTNTCGCGDFPKCHHALVEMSSDGERFPIEPGIAPLVYALNLLAACETCWSCAGHMDDNGHLTRHPRVVFYLRSPIVCSVLADYLSDLHFKKNLNYKWQVVVTPMGNKLDVSYTIQPNLEDQEFPKLALLHNDIQTIAGELASGLAETAYDFLSEIGVKLQQAS